MPFTELVAIATQEEAAHMLGDQAHGVYVIHQAPELNRGSHPGFDAITISVVMEGGEILTNRLFLCRPDEFRFGSSMHQTWRPFNGWLTISERPWEDDPRDLTSSGGLIKDAGAMSKMFPFLRAPLIPHIAPLRGRRRDGSPRIRSVSPVRRNGSPPPSPQFGPYPGPQRRPMMFYGPQHQPYLVHRDQRSPPPNRNNPRPSQPPPPPFRPPIQMYPRPRSPNFTNGNGLFGSYNSTVAAGPPLPTRPVLSTKRLPVQPLRPPNSRHAFPDAGVGLHFTSRNGIIFISQVDPGSSADFDRVVAQGDIVLAINGETTEYMSVPEVNRKVWGPPGTICVLHCKRRGGPNFRESFFEATLVRGDDASLV